MANSPKTPNGKAVALRVIALHTSDGGAKETRRDSTPSLELCGIISRSHPEISRRCERIRIGEEFAIREPPYAGRAPSSRKFKNFFPGRVPHACASVRSIASINSRNLNGSARDRSVPLWSEARRNGDAPTFPFDDKWDEGK